MSAAKTGSSSKKAILTAGSGENVWEDMAFMSFKISAWAPVAKADALLSWSGLREQFFINPFRELFNLPISIN
jgi:hypothetical protein